jgi:hypothetical protein
MITAMLYKDVTFAVEFRTILKRLAQASSKPNLLR